MGIRHTAALVLATACQAGPSNHSGFSSTPDITTTSVSSGEGSTTTNSGDSSGTTSSDGKAASTSTSIDSDSATAPQIFDLGSSADLGDGKPVGCKGKIDFLFVVSRDYGMKLVQTQLIDAFPKFIATIQEKFANFDYHIMVVDGDTHWGHTPCNEQCTPDGCKYIPDYPCDLLDLVTECDQTLGAGNVFAAGGQATNKPCAIDGGRRYLTREQANLDKTFECVAQLGISGRGWIGEALTAAVSPQLNWKGACNEGFLRDDALLMVTLVSDSYDWEGKPLGSSGTPEEWAKAVIDAKHGDPRSVVMFSLLDPACPPDDRTCTMVKMFPYWFIEYGGVPDYGPAFDSASDLVQVACEGFSPPG